MVSGAAAGGTTRPGDLPSARSLPPPFGPARGWHDPWQPEPVKAGGQADSVNRIERPMPRPSGPPRLPRVVAVGPSPPGVSGRDRTTATRTPQACTTRVIPAADHPGLPSSRRRINRDHPSGCETNSYINSSFQLGGRTRDYYGWASPSTQPSPAKSWWPWTGCRSVRGSRWWVGARAPPQHTNAFPPPPLAPEAHGQVRSGPERREPGSREPRDHAGRRGLRAVCPTWLRGRFGHHGTTGSGRRGDRPGGAHRQLDRPSPALPAYGRG
jgi:hypothetical protein